MRVGKVGSWAQRITKPLLMLLRAFFSFSNVADTIEYGWVDTWYIYIYIYIQINTYIHIYILYIYIYIYIHERSHVFTVQSIYISIYIYIHQHIYCTSKMCWIHISLYLHRSPRKVSESLWACHDRVHWQRHRGVLWAVGWAQSHHQQTRLWCLGWYESG